MIKKPKQSVSFCRSALLKGGSRLLSRLLSRLFIVLFSTSCLASTTKEITENLTHEILKNSQAYSNLKELVAGGSRLSGSAGAAHAVEWGKSKLESYGFDKVWLQEVMVPHWERGHRETAVITSGAKAKLQVAALGNSVGTGDKGIEAEVIEVSGIDDAILKGPKLKDKIVFFNGPMDPTVMDTFEAYGRSVKQRTRGAAQASQFGAVAVLVRSMTMNHDMHLHAGVMQYKDAPQKIPAATIATADADKLSELLKSNKIRIKLNLSAKSFDQVKSYNVIGEMTGSELPNEFIVVGGHLDSWDLGPGAQDDGVGVVQSIEVLRAMRALSIKPKRSIRVVLFMAEEFGGFGGDEYAKQAALKKELHIAAVESDRGGFTPRGFETSAEGSALKKLESWKEYFLPLKSDLIKKGEGGTDIEPLRESGTAQFGLFPDSARYFDYHHTQIDTIDAVNARELNLGAAAMSVLIYLISDEGLK